MADVHLSLRELKNSVSLCLKKIENSSIRKLSNYQLDALYSLMCRNDTFVSLPTGHGKSLIYQLSVLVASNLSKENSSYPSSPVVLVVSPLNSLIDDQISSCSRLGLKACKLNSTSILQAQEFSVCFTSPEVLETPACFPFVQKLENRLLAVVVDESHCTLNWGLGEKDVKPFREAYGKIGNVRAITKAPIICLTATASRSMRNKIIKLLGMKMVKVIRLSPNKENIKMTFKKASNEIGDTLSWVIKELSEKGIEMPKTIIYCRSLKNCGDIYSLFNENLNTREHYAMYHSKTPERIQKRVLSSLVDPDGLIRIVIATSALGLGVNIPSVRWVLHYGLPKNIEDYVQEIGQAGRDGLQSFAVAYYRGFHLAHCNSSMRNFVKNIDRKCRRELVSNYFKETSSTKVNSDMCCDICSQETPSHKESTDSSASSYSMSRVVDEEDKTLLKDTLKLIPDNPNKTSVFGTSSLVNLTESLIDNICKSACFIFDVEFLMDNFAIFDSWLAHEILTVFNEVFEDISETELLKAKNLEDFWLNDLEIDVSIPEWCFSPNSDSDFSE